MLLLKYNSLLYFLFLKNPSFYSPIINNNNKLVYKNNLSFNYFDDNSNEMLMELKVKKKDNFINSDYMSSNHIINIDQKLSMLYKDDLYEDIIKAKVNVDNYHSHNLITLQTKDSLDYFLKNDYLFDFNHSIFKNNKKVNFDEVKLNFDDTDLF